LMSWSILAMEDCIYVIDAGPGRSFPAVALGHQDELPRLIRWQALPRGKMARVGGVEGIAYELYLMFAAVRTAVGGFCCCCRPRRCRAISAFRHRGRDVKLIAGVRDDVARSYLLGFAAMMIRRDSKTYQAYQAAAARLRSARRRDSVRARREECCPARAGQDSGLVPVSS